MKELLLFIVTFFAFCVSAFPQNLNNVPQVISQNNGVLNINIRQSIGNSDHHFGAATPDIAAGHSYVSLNSLGTSNLSPQQIMSAIHLDPNSVFPFFQAQGTAGQALQVGSHYTLAPQIPNIPYSVNPVTVTADNPFYFTFTADPGHNLIGSVTHAVFRDSTGELWLLQVGNGVAGAESLDRIALNNVAAAVMWEKMADNVKKLIKNFCPPGETKNYDAVLNGILNTGIVVLPGQEVILQARGIVVLGPIAGSANPTGIDYGVYYNLATQFKHGSLITRLSSENPLTWHYVGFGTKFNVVRAGELQLAVNDTDNTNNDGFFKVAISIVCQRPVK